MRKRDRGIRREERTGRKSHKGLAQILTISGLVILLASLFGVNGPKDAHHVLGD